MSEKEKAEDLQKRRNIISKLTLDPEILMEVVDDDDYTMYDPDLTSTSDYESDSE